jgi:kynurenine formamidase
MMLSSWATLWAAIFIASSAHAGTASPITAERFDGWMAEISNWGRWGAHDQLGTLNLITPEKRRAAAALVREGLAVSLSLPLNKIADELNTNPFHHELQTGTFGGHDVAGDRYAVEYHGFAHSHLDGLPHFITNGKMYNGVPASVLKPTGADKLGIDNAHVGVFTRAVLVDMPRLKGVDFLEPESAITVEDLEAWEKHAGVRVESGDVLLVRTGRWERVRRKGQWNFVESASGMHASVAPWLKARDVAMIGCDGVSDVMPSGHPGGFNPLHELVLVALGMPIFDNLDLDAVAKAAAERNRWAFLLTAAPLFPAAPAPPSTPSPSSIAG